MRDDEVHKIGEDVYAYVDSDGGITLKAVTPVGDPVELTSPEARKLAALLIQLADLYDA